VAEAWGLGIQQASHWSEKRTGERKEEQKSLTAVCFMFCSISDAMTAHNTENTYSIAVEEGEGLGLNLWLFDERVRVKSFFRNEGTMLTAEKSGLCSIGDILVGIDEDISLFQGLLLEQVVDLVKSRRRPFFLRFVQQQQQQQHQQPRLISTTLSSVAKKAMNAANGAYDLLSSSFSPSSSSTPSPLTPTPPFADLDTPTHAHMEEEEETEELVALPLLEDLLSSPSVVCALHVFFSRKYARLPRLDEKEDLDLLRGSIRDFRREFGIKGSAKLLAKVLALVPPSISIHKHLAALGDEIPPPQPKCFAAVFFGQGITSISSLETSREQCDDEEQGDEGGDVLREASLPIDLSAFLLGLELTPSKQQLLSLQVGGYRIVIRKLDRALWTAKNKRTQNQRFGCIFVSSASPSQGGDVFSTRFLRTLAGSVEQVSPKLDADKDIKQLPSIAALITSRSSCKEEEIVATSELEFAIVLELLTPRSLAALLVAMLLELKIVLVSSNSISSHTYLVEVLQACLRPLAWPHMLCPWLPTTLVENGNGALLNCPFPFIIGFSQSSSSPILPDSLCVFDLDSGAMRLPSTFASHFRVGRRLVATLEALFKPAFSGCDTFPLNNIELVSSSLSTSDHRGRMIVKECNAFVNDLLAIDQLSLHARIVTLDGDGEEGLQCATTKSTSSSQYETEEIVFFDEASFTSASVVGNGNAIFIASFLRTQAFSNFLVQEISTTSKSNKSER